MVGPSTTVTSINGTSSAALDSASEKAQSTSERPQAPQPHTDAPQQGLDSGLIAVLASLAAVVVAAGAVASLWYCRRKGHVREPEEGAEQDCAEFNFVGKPGTGKVVVVSCPGGPDKAFRMAKGEIYAHIKATQDLAVNVIYIKGAHIAEFWDAWRHGLLQFAEGKEFIVTITKGDGSIGHVQKQEVAYLERCTGQKGMPDFRNAKMVAMNYKEFFCWGRQGYKEEALGRCLSEDFQIEFCTRLPSLDEMQERFRGLASSRVTAHAHGAESCSAGELEAGLRLGGGLHQELSPKATAHAPGPESRNAEELETGQCQGGIQEEQEPCGFPRTSASRTRRLHISL